jgi:hypothetical protein
MARFAGSVSLERSLKMRRPLSRRTQKLRLRARGFAPRGGLARAGRSGDLQRREFHEALLDADPFEDLPGKWQAAILKSEENRPKLRIVDGD